MQSIQLFIGLEKGVIGFFYRACWKGFRGILVPHRGEDLQRQSAASENIQKQYKQYVFFFLCGVGLGPKPKTLNPKP